MMTEIDCFQTPTKVMQSPFWYITISVDSYNSTAILFLLVQWVIVCFCGSLHIKSSVCSLQEFLTNTNLLLLKYPHHINVSICSYLGSWLSFFLLKTWNLGFKARIHKPFTHLALHTFPSSTCENKNLV
jgi:hypothetical protein